MASGAFTVIFLFTTFQVESDARASHVEINTRLDKLEDIDKKLDRILKAVE